MYLYRTVEEQLNQKRSHKLSRGTFKNLLVRKQLFAFIL